MFSVDVDIYMIYMFIPLFLMSLLLLLFLFLLEILDGSQSTYLFNPYSMSDQKAKPTQEHTYTGQINPPPPRQECSAVHV